MRNKELLKNIWLQIFNELPPIDVATLKVHLDDYIKDLLETQTEEDEQTMRDIITPNPIAEDKPDQEYYIKCDEIIEELKH